MAMNETQLPLGKTKTVRTGDYLYTLEVVGWNEKLRCNVWAEKSKRFSPAPGINGYQLAKAMKASDDWDYTRRMAKRVNSDGEAVLCQE